MESTLPEIRATSWAELHDLLYAESWHPGLRRFRSRSAYRGVANAAYSLRTSLMRLGPDHQRLEGHLLRNFRKFAQRDAVAGDSVWNWLALAQHHGLPTRLLDWSYSPYIAIHFATADVTRSEMDGVVWCVDYAQTHKQLPDALRAILAEEDADVFTVEMLDRAAAGLREFQSLATTDFLVFFRAAVL